MTPDEIARLRALLESIDAAGAYTDRLAREQVERARDAIIAEVPALLDALEAATSGEEIKNNALRELEAVLLRHENRIAEATRERDEARADAKSLRRTVQPAGVAAQLAYDAAILHGTAPQWKKPEGSGTNATDDAAVRAAKEKP